MLDHGSIRSKFLGFFEEKGHKIVPSAPMVNKDDPTLLFINAGMNQFKDNFLGNKKPPASRVADTQKCLRVSGKHNDLEEVGIDTYHHTFFEMLGNWSFGDYFKKEAIAWSWELLTEVFKIPKEQLYVTVFGGDEGDGLPPDDEAEELWGSYVPKERILHCDKSDNFWEMGDQGPCGPCTEIHVDIRPESERKAKPGRDLVNMDHPQVIEIWNVVFIQFNRMADGSLQPLADKHIDTGLGLERLCMVLQGKTSNYDTDLFQPLLQTLAKWSDIPYGKAEDTDVAMRVIADHVKAVAFAIADGQLPSNTGAGYVIRRILRRAVRYGYTFLNFEEPFIHRLLPELEKLYAEVFPEIPQQLDFIETTIREEEKSFLKTLETGIGLFEAFVNDKRWNNKPIEGAELSAWENKIVPGRFAFELFDTFGFPLDLTQLLAREKGFAADMQGFEKHMAEQKARSKKAAASETGDWNILIPDADSVFVGYDNLEASSKILKYRPIKRGKKSYFQVVLDQTPFYAESGGQVGDIGTLSNGEEAVKVVDTQKENELIVHLVEKMPAKPEGVFTAKVDAQYRQESTLNHTATHLLHAALREVLGEHVQQKGSLVSPKLLRFDFSHPDKLSDAQIEEIENIVNQKIRENILGLCQDGVPLAEAKAKGAMALFGEKYGESVRMVTFDPAYSIELCGGTHVKQTGEIGLFTIVSEGSVASGVRRIEALTGKKAQSHLAEQARTVQALKQVLNTQEDPLKKVEQLLKEKASLQKSLERMETEKAAGLKDELDKKAKDENGLRVIIEKADFPNGDAAKKVAFDLRNQYKNLFLVLAGEQSGKAYLLIMAGEEAQKAMDLKAGQLIRDWAKHIKGGGGGQDFFAMAGGKDPQGAPKALAEAESFLSKALA